ncbi:MAG: Sua5 family C-terminal domain-containing protein, partial [Chthoniobacterales bacterium]
VSPTTATHVFSELDGRIPLIVNGGSCTHGIESTIIAIHENTISILRHGPVTAEELSTFAPLAPMDKNPMVPGSLKSHYAPRHPLFILEEDTPVATPPSRCGFLAWQSEGSEYKKTIKLSEHLDLKEAAAHLYAAMRSLDDSDIELIVAEPVPETGIGKAIMDRLRKAAARE